MMQNEEWERDKERERKSKGREYKLKPTKNAIKLVLSFLHIIYVQI